MAHKMFKHSAGSAFNVVESEEIYLLSGNLVIKNNNIFSLSVYSLNQCGGADEKPEFQLIEHSDCELGNSPWQSPVMNPNTINDCPSPHPFGMVCPSSPILSAAQIFGFEANMCLEQSVSYFIDPFR